MSRRVDMLKRLRGDPREKVKAWRYVRHMQASVKSPELFQSGARLPPGYGQNLSERAVEYGWTMGQRPRGQVLDAGSTLNQWWLIDELLDRFDDLTIFTLAPEAESYPERGITYLYGDLREMPFDDGAFDRVVSLSVLEHVGMDNSVYGAEAETPSEPRAERASAVREMARVTAPGGELLISVPFGNAADHGWYQVLDRADLDHLVAAAGGEATEWLYVNDGDGWQLCDDTQARSASVGHAVACVRIAVSR